MHTKHKTVDQKAVNALVREIKTVWIHGEDRRIELGLKFVELKRLLPHGYFKKAALKACRGITYASVNSYMKEARQVSSQKFRKQTFETTTSAGLVANPEFGKPVVDPHAEALERAKAEQKKRREGLPPSLVGQFRLRADSLQQLKELKAGMKKVTPAELTNMFWLKGALEERPKQSRPGRVVISRTIIPHNLFDKF
jgi:hypothetical protein